MIQKTNIWLKIIPEDFDPKPIKGKWLYFGKTESLHMHAEKLNDLVDRGILKAAKIARKLPEHDPFPNKPCVLCVYTSDKQKEKEFVKNALFKNLGLIPLSWKSNAETDMDWGEEGKLRKEYLENIRNRAWDKHKHLLESK